MSTVCARGGIGSYGELERAYGAGELDDLFGLVAEAVRPGDHVVLKPNFVKEFHLERPDEWSQIVTNGSLIRCVLDAVLGALDGSGSVAIVDAPQTDSDYDAVIARVGLPAIVEEARAKTETPISYFDLREERWYFRDGIITSKRKLRGDPMGYVEVDLGRDSFFAGKANKDYYGADYDRSETARYHNEENNIYVISRTILDADVFINLPKLKTHKLGGMTCCLKNLVGTCVIKNSLPHHTLGSPETGGDQFEHAGDRSRTEGRLKAAAVKLLKYKNPLINYPFILVKKLAGVFLGQASSETVRNGSWHGNDTIWRTTLDLNRILLYADKDGVMCSERQRRYIAFVDAVVAGDGNGPMAADAKECGLVLAGTNPVVVDFAACRLMGFDWNRVPTVSHGFDAVRWPLVEEGPEEVLLESNDSRWRGPVLDVPPKDTLRFRPHFGWVGHVELGA